ncbi:M56 family metallopeptidase [Seonamhaeicola sp. ML3]|uniref:M56 family metallopeptidase n=1 Tax=Seonamhaeicola sp. ML3 TaxID=2937786 RepID=UPI00200E345D|nr:M56 family metallopeptidase [Seonamhaeicola sp. ML3]
MEYLLKASAIILIFYACYKIFLQRDTFFEWSRAFLLVGLVAAFSVPFIIIPIYIERSPMILDDYMFNNTIPVITQQVYDATLSPLDIITYLYFSGVVFFLVRLLFQLSSLTYLLVKQKKTKQTGFTLVETDSNTNPFSFFRWIVYNPKLFDKNELQQILTHEKVHVNQWHSIDILISQLVSTILWLNPIIWLYNRDLKQNLEFIADKNTQQKVACKKDYQNILLKTSMPTHQLALTNNFYNSLIKKRIVMLQKSKSKRINLFKYLLILPALSWFLMSFNTVEVYIDKPILNNQQLIDNTIEIKIHKDLSNILLKDIETQLVANNITFTYTNLKRNSNNEITSIDTKFEIQNGGHCTFKAVNNNNNPIHSFYFYKNNEAFGVRAEERESQEIEKFIIHNNFTDTRLKTLEKDLNDKGFQFNLKEIGRDAGHFINSIFFTISKNDAEESYRIASAHPLETILIQFNKQENYFNINTVNFIRSLESAKNESDIIKIIMNKNATPEILTEQKKRLKEQYDIDFSFEMYESKRSEGHLMSYSIGKGKNLRKITTSAEETCVILYNPKTNSTIAYSLDKNNNPKYGKVHHLNTISEHRYILTKDISNKSLKVYSKNLLEKGIKVKFEDLERNSKGEITKISITAESEINKISSTWDDNNNPIPQIEVGNDMSGRVIVRTSNLKLPKNKKDKDFSKVSEKPVFKQGGHIINADSIIWKSVRKKVNTKDQTDDKSQDIQNPIFIIDGKEVEKSVYENMYSDQIESITVLKGESATIPFGDRGQNGAVMIKTKSKTSINPRTIKVGRNALSDSTSLNKLRLFSVDEKNKTHTIKMSNEGQKNRIIYYEKTGNITFEGHSIVKINEIDLVFIDSKKSSLRKAKKLSPKNIKSIKVLKGQEAKEKYGIKVKNGVLEITTKK